MSVQLAVPSVGSADTTPNNQRFAHSRNGTISQVEKQKQRHERT